MLRSQKSVSFLFTNLNFAENPSFSILFGEYISFASNFLILKLSFPGIIVRSFSNKSGTLIITGFFILRISKKSHKVLLWSSFYHR